MATTVDRFESGRATYPWSDWANGEIWRAVEGVDFVSTVDGFRSALYCHARSRGLTVRIAVKRDSKQTAVEFQFSKRRRRKAS